jgi:hypothetical protein
MPLGADKFMIDGRHTAPAAATTSSSAGRRWKTARSCAARTCCADPYWQRHPSLSYLFSGLFIGPTSQAPTDRRGAPRHALRAGDRAGADPRTGRGADYRRPWLVDRLLPQHADGRDRQHPPGRDLHRQALFPDGPTGRLGLVEFRGFEMPPHPRMSLAQQLLLRAMIARFWQRTRSTGRRCAGARRCMTASCCPHFVWEDFLDVLRDLEAHGFELRSGLVRGAARVPLPVLRRGRCRGRAPGAAAGAGAVARAGRDRRHRRHRALHRQLGGAVAGALTAPTRPLPRVCNRRPHAAGADGPPGGVGGLRFKAWQPAEALHPVLPVNAPLTFDIYDPGRAAARRMRLPRRASGRAELRDLPGQRQRGGGAPAGAVRASWPFTPALHAGDGGSASGVSDDAGPAPQAGPDMTGRAQKQDLFRQPPCCGIMHLRPGVADELLDATGVMRPALGASFIRATCRNCRSRSDGTSLISRGRSISAGCRSVFPPIQHRPSCSERDWPLSHIPVILHEREWDRDL